MEAIHEAHPNLNLDVQDIVLMTQSSYSDRTLSWYDSYLGWNDRRLSVLSLEGSWVPPLERFLLPLQPDLFTYIKPKFIRQSAAGEYMSLPYRANQIVVYIRRDLFEKHGIEYKYDTWANWEACLAELQEKEQERRNDSGWRSLMYVHGGDNSRMTDFVLTVMSGWDAGEIVDANGTVTFNNPMTVQALKMIVRWQRTLANAQVHTATTHEHVRDEILDDRAAVAFSLTSFTGLYQSYNDNPPVEGFKIEAVPVPGPRGAGCSVHSVAAIANVTDLFHDFSKSLVRNLANVLADSIVETYNQEPIDTRVQDDPARWSQYCGLNPMLCKSMEDYPSFWSRLAHRPAGACGVNYESCIGAIKNVMVNVITETITPEAAVSTMEFDLNVVLGNAQDVAYVSTSEWTDTRITLIIVCVLCGLGIIVLFGLVFARLRNLRKPQSPSIPITVFLGVIFPLLFFVVQFIVIQEWNKAYRDVTEDFSKTVRRQSLELLANGVTDQLRATIIEKGWEAESASKAIVESKLTNQIYATGYDPRILLVMLDRDEHRIALSSDERKQKGEVSMISNPEDISEWVQDVLDLLGSDWDTRAVPLEEYAVDVDGERVDVNMRVVYVSVDISSGVKRTVRYLFIQMYPYAVTMEEADRTLAETVDLSVILSVVGITALLVVIAFLMLPLVRLALDMEKVRLLNLDALVLTQGSRLTEIASLLLGFQSMCQMLTEYKAFMPKTLFDVGDSDLDPDSDVEDTATVTRTHQSRSHRSGASVSEMSSSKVAHAITVGAMTTVRGVVAVIRIPAMAVDGGSVEIFQKAIVVIERVVGLCRGVLHAFNTVKINEIVVSWGLSGARSSNERSADCMCKIRDELKLQHDIFVAIGAAFGKFRSGNVGNQSSRGFAILGVPLMEAFAAVTSAEILVNRAALPALVVDCEFPIGNNGFCFRGIDLGRFAGRFRILYLLVGSLSQDNNQEWMYELAEQEDKNTPLTKFFVSCIEDGSMRKAEADLGHTPEEKAVVKALTAL
eukprot:gene8835-13691_t